MTIISNTLALLMIFFISQTVAQNVLKEFGDISTQDFQTLQSDSTDAVIIFDKGDVVVDPGQVMGTTFKRHIRIKIFKKTALQWTNFEFLVIRNGFARPKGATYNLENGSIIKTTLEDGSIFESRHNKYSDNVRIAFPDVREGSIIELSYVIKYQNLYLPGWQFQHSIPTLWSQYSLRAPRTDYISHLRGSLKPTKYEEKYEGKYKSWVMSDVPAFIPEALMPDEKVYISSVEFGTYYKTWEAIRNHLVTRADFGGILLHHNFLKEKVREITVGITDSLEKIKAISNYVKDQVRFNGINDFLSDPPPEVIERKNGSAGDINLLFGSLLKKAGFEVSMVLLSTRDHGFVLQDFPSSGQFDYVICHVTINNKRLLLDATEKLLPFDYLPQKCFSHKGFLVSAEFYGWIGIEPDHRNKTSVEANLILNHQGNLSGKFTFSKYEYAAFKARNAYFDLGEKELIKDMLGNQLWDIKKSDILNGKDIEKPVIGNYEAALDGYATVSQELIVINPHIFLREDFNKFTEETREYPIDFPELTDNYVMINITIPEGYEVEELPKSKGFRLPENAAKCTISISKAGNRITVLSRLQINRTLFQPYEYQNLKEFYAILIANKSENIVLKKK